ncbi:type I DNA topoisomerase [filamentous cyanobacterium LEGE 11480]|uniref:DNA topoisomerase 1 n=1 Tax=Romeriopsis navalis LEGE 11480 TaxID=2777977 RepID=A0A928Z5I0_9CYAN|nr:type I DNA topoisomerase [Romeriopsis navalis]MBE9032012.1 type I DNA topoisomerase [Romeriopsis navalis LEGE 11480]
MSTLVIVESPTKAKTIRNYLPKGYRVEASMGHVRDLPQSTKDVPKDITDKRIRELGVDVRADFDPIYLIPSDKKKVVKTLKDALKEADELLLATDEDREGESISWHLMQILKPKVPVKRMVFHEITEEAIKAAIKDCRDVDEKLVRAQETRRILDRLVGYTISPLLWKKIKYGLSAGRVQSVAVRLTVRRERERRAFKQGSYWDLKALLAPAADKKKEFEAKLISLGGTKLATGADFDENTGAIAEGKKVVLLNEQESQELQARLDGKPWTVTKLEEKPTTRKPSPPFITSTLQQEANRKLGMSARETMRTAQGLYEKGFITYMRTDSVNLSQQAISAARSGVETKYGKEYLSPSPRQYTTKSKGAQEAHEAIRPAGSSFRTPQETGLADREFRLYDLIWKRTMATQMADARQTNITMQISVEDAIFRASGKRIDFPGFFRAYVEGSDDPDAAIEGQELILPNLKQGDHPNCQNLDAIGHETQPPARYTEASLVKMLESEGIGRPSTYASILGTIIDRGYVQPAGNSLVPTFTAFAVTALLEQHFPDLVDPSFTARMERTLDDISMGEAEWLPYLKDFYLGDEGLETQVQEQESEIDPGAAKTISLADLCAKVRIGKYGAYLELDQEDGEVVKANIPNGLTPADLDAHQVEVLIKQKLDGPEKLGLHPDTGEAIYVLIGTYGPYVQLGEVEEGSKKKPKRSSLPKGTTPENITLQQAVGLLSLPRTLGLHPDTGRKVQSSLGRFGPYVVHDLGKGEDGKVKKDYRSLKGDDDPVTVTFERALELLAQPKATRGRRSATPLRELGPHPDDDEPVNIYDGPYGHYVKHGKINASLPEGQTLESMTMELAVVALAAKAETSGKKKTTKKKSTTKKKTTAKKTTTTKKTAAKKTPAKSAASTTKKTAAKKTSTTTKKATAAKAKAAVKDEVAD